MKVAVALIFNSQEKILVTQRPINTSHPGYWEFPGGKLEEGELPEQALVREIREEIGLEITGYQYLGEVHHDYPNKSVDLLVFRISSFTGQARCLEGQPAMKWIKRDEFNSNEFPAANHSILNLLDRITENIE